MSLFSSLRGKIMIIVSAITLIATTSGELKEIWSWSGDFFSDRYKKTISSYYQRTSYSRGLSRDLVFKLIQKENFCVARWTWMDLDMDGYRSDIMIEIEKNKDDYEECQSSEENYGVLNGYDVIVFRGKFIFLGMGFQILKRFRGQDETFFRNIAKRKIILESQFGMSEVYMTLHILHEEELIGVGVSSDDENFIYTNEIDVDFMEIEDRIYISGRYGLGVLFFPDEGDPYISYNAFYDILERDQLARFVTVEILKGEGNETYLEYFKVISRSGENIYYEEVLLKGKRDGGSYYGSNEIDEFEKIYFGFPCYCEGFSKKGVHFVLDNESNKARIICQIGECDDGQGDCTVAILEVEVEQY